MLPALIDLQHSAIKVVTVVIILRRLFKKYTWIGDVYAARDQLF